MFDIILGAAAEDVWTASAGRVEFRRDYSRVITDAGVVTADQMAFGYQQGQAALTTAALNNLVILTNVGDLDTSIRDANHVNETLVATHLCAEIQEFTSANVRATDNIIVWADFQELMGRTVIDLYHESQKGPDDTRLIGELPAARGNHVFATVGALVSPQNGPPHQSSARPLRSPLLYLSGQDKTGPYAGRSGGPTFLQVGVRFNQDRGGLQVTQETGIMFYLEGYALV